MFSLLSMIKEEQRKFHRRYEKDTFVLKKKSFFICTLEIVLYKDLVSGPTKETGIDRAAPYLMLNLRKP